MSANGADFEWHRYTGEPRTMPRDYRRKIHIMTRRGIESKNSYLINQVVWDWNGSEYDVVKWRYVENEVERKKRLEKENV